jgi:hypothetical protein
MTDDQLKSIGEALERVAGVFAEFRRQWHPSMGGEPPFGLLDECLAREAQRIRGEGQSTLADGLLALRSELGATNNG